MAPDGSDFTSGRARGAIRQSGHRLQRLGDRRRVAAVWRPGVGKASRKSGIYLIGLDGAVIRLTTSTNPTVEKPGGACGGGDGHPDFSADGQFLLFVNTKCGSGPDPSSDQSAQLVVANADGTNSRVVLPYGVADLHGGGKAGGFRRMAAKLSSAAKMGSSRWSIRTARSRPKFVTSSRAAGRTHLRRPGRQMASGSCSQCSSTGSAPTCMSTRTDGTELTRITYAVGTEAFASWRP